MRDATTELVGHSALVRARRESGSTVEDDNFTVYAGVRNLKMCPACCSGPLSNEHCADMVIHHGQCSVEAFGNDSCDFKAKASEIESLMTRVSDLDWNSLPKWDSNARSLLELD